MKASLRIAILSVILIGLLMYSTNPREEQFEKHVEWYLKDVAQETGGVSGFLLDLFSKPTAWISNLSIQRVDYTFFSMYGVTVAGQDLVFIGVFNNFYRVH